MAYVIFCLTAIIMAYVILCFMAILMACVILCVSWLVLSYSFWLYSKTLRGVNTQKIKGVMLVELNIFWDN